MVIEARNANAVSELKVMAGEVDITSKFAAPVKAELDCDASSDYSSRANLQSLEQTSEVTVSLSLTADGANLTDRRMVTVRPFSMTGRQRRNIILFIGDAMGTAYRDSARLVSRSIVDANGNSTFREGLFDDLLEMDKMPIAGMSMTYSTDCRWRFNGITTAATQPFILDNPRVDNLWQYLKRRFNYCAGIVTTATELKALQFGQPVIGLFNGSRNPAPGSNGITTAADVNMDVAYDKLKLPRPASEPAANLGTFTDQPMLETMTEKAIEVLSSSFSQSPFILMVEAASIDKQSHPNNAAGTIWDTIELDKSVGVARAWAAKRTQKDTLIIVTADHGQSMHLIGVSNTPDDEFLNRNKSTQVTYTTPAGTSNFTVYGDSYSNARAGLPFNNASTGNSNNGGARGMPGSFAPTNSATNPASSTYSTYFGSPSYRLDPATGYPVNTGAGIRRLSVGFRTGDHTASSVPVTAEGPGAFLFTGYMDQTDIFFKMAAAVSTDTSEGDKLVDLLKSTQFPQSVGK